MSCFALHAGWTPGRLAAGTRYTSYDTVGASTVRDLGYEVWATDTFTEGESDPTNPVHLDIVIQRNIPLDVLADRTGTPAQRRDLRNRFLPELERLLGRLDGPRPLDGDEDLQVGAKLLVHDGDVTYLSATVTAHEGDLWELTLQRERA